MKKKFRILEEQQYVRTWTYEVEADNEEEAKRMVTDGVIDWVDFDDNPASDDYEIVYVEEITTP